MTTTTRIVSEGEKIARSSTNAWQIIQGNTFAIKDQLKKLGAKWDGVNKGWLVPHAKLQQAYDLLYGPLPE